MTTGFMMGYHPGATVTGVPNGPLVDYRFGRVFTFGEGTNPAVAGVRYHDAYPNGIETRARTLGDIGTIAGIIDPQVYCYNTQRLAFIPANSNSESIHFLNARDLTYFGSFGVENSSLADSTTFRIKCPVQFCAIQDAYGGDYIITAGLVAGGEINCVAVVTQTNTRLGAIDEAHASVGSVPDGSGTSGFILGYATSTTTAPTGLYSVTKSGFVKLGTVLPAQIDATWTKFSEWRGVTVDQTDGNPIVGFGNQAEGSTHQGYIAKLSKVDASVLWAIAVSPGGLNYSGQDMARNLVKNGRLYYLAGNPVNTLCIINTVAGTMTTQTLSDAALDTLHGAQVSEDVSNSIFWLGSWTENTTHPAYLGDYMLTQGIHTGSAMTFRYWPGPGAPVVPAVVGLPAASRKRAWSFALDGHVFYVLDLASEGTFLYDDTTGKWCKFITQNQYQWNLTNGTMWGKRIVGGDIDTTDIWEMQPGALKDNGSVDIVRVVTGGLIKRTRVFSSVESFKMSLSVGQLDNQAGGASILLEFSDDQGQTFTAMPAIALTEGDFSAEITWRSLGSFAAPGRIFRITDVGGFLRIDGADAALDNFDEDAQSGQAG